LNYISIGKKNTLTFFFYIYQKFCSIYFLLIQNVMRKIILCHKGTALLQSADCSYKCDCEHIQKEYEGGSYVYQPPHLFPS